MRFIKRTDIVEAIQHYDDDRTQAIPRWFVDFAIDHPDIESKPGDWIIKDQNGINVISNDDFIEQYAPLP